VDEGLAGPGELTSRSYAVLFDRTSGMTTRMTNRDLPRPAGRTLDDEGVPDLEGPLPEKELTGDSQEGVPPPSDRPASFDYGVTPEEDSRGEPISVRVAREQPDVVVADEDEPSVRLVDDEALQPGEEPPVDEDELIGTAEEPGESGLSAEEAAVHVRDDAPGAVGGPDSYVPDDA
jgi:hypothetical protein